MKKLLLLAICVVTAIVTACDPYTDSDPEPFYYTNNTLEVIAIGYITGTEPVTDFISAWDSAYKIAIDPGRTKKTTLHRDYIRERGGMTFIIAKPTPVYDRDGNYIDDDLVPFESFSLTYNELRSLSWTVTYPLASTVED